MSNTSKIEEALQQLYTGNDPQTIYEIQQWLTTIQTSLDAWQFCWPLMAEDKAAPIQFFGACTIKTKIANCWPELPADQYIPLRDQIIQFIIRFANGAPFVRCQLCSALAILTLRITPNYWSQPVKELIQFSSQQMDYQAVFIEIISEITNMFDKSGLVTIDRANVRHIMEASYSDVIALIQSSLGVNTSNQLKIQALKCLASWIAFGLTIRDLDSLVPTLFDLLRNDALFEAAISALMEIGTSGESSQYPSSLYQFMKLLTKLTPLIEETIRNECIDECGDICNLVVSAAECHSKYFTKFENNDHRKLANELASMILNFACMNGYYPIDETCSRLTFEFWYSLQTEIECLETINTELSRKQLSACYEDYKPMFITLMKALTLKIKYPLNDALETWSSDDREQFEIYRHDVGEAIMLTNRFLQSECLKFFYENLSNLTSNIQSSDWQTFEVYLYLIRAISDSISSSDSQYIRGIFRLLPELPTHEKIGTIALKVIGSYCEYLKYDNEILLAIIPRILWSLREPKLVYAAVVALRDICVDCAEELKASATTIFNTCQEVLSGPYLMLNQRIPLVESMGSIIAVMDKSTVEVITNQICAQLIGDVINVIRKPETASSRYEIILQLKSLKAFYLTANFPSDFQPNPFLSSSENALATFHEILLKWNHDEQVSEAVVECLIRMIGNLHTAAVSLLSALVEFLLHWYKTSPRPCYLNCAKQVMMLFSGDKNALSAVAHLYYTLTSGTLQRLETGSSTAPDLVNAFLIFNEKAVKTSSEIVFSNSDVYNKLLPFGLASMVFKENYVIKSNSRFLVEFIAKVNTIKEAKKSVELYGKLIVSKIILGIAGEVPRVSLKPLVDIIFELNKHCITNLATWIEELFEETAFPCATLNQTDKQAFKNVILRSRARKRWLQEQVEEFALKCRGLYGTNYAKDVQSSLIP